MEKYRRLGKKSAEEAAWIWLDLPVYHDNIEAFSDRGHWLFLDDNRGAPELSRYGNAKGFCLYGRTYLSTPYSPKQAHLDCPGTAEMDPTAESLYRDFLSDCRERGVDLLLVMAPFLSSEQDVRESRTLEKIAGEYGFPFLRMENILEETGIAFETDYCDTSHVNLLGAEKYTAFLAEYLAENYGLPDHREDAGYASWQEEWEAFEASQAEPRASLIGEISGEPAEE